MRVATQTLLLGATTAALAYEQKVLSNFDDAPQQPLEHVTDGFRNPLDRVTEALGEMPTAAKVSGTK